MNDLQFISSISPIGDLLVKGAAEHPGRDAIVFPESRRTYGELLQGAIRVTRGLLAQGVRPRDNVGILLGNSVDFVEAFFGISLLGCVVVPLNARHKATELGFIIANADMTALVTNSEAGGYVDFAEVIATALPSLHSARGGELALPEAPKLRRIILLKGGGRNAFVSREEFDRAADTVEETVVDELRYRVRVRDTAVIIYTSGTTANPKGCMLSHEAMTRGAITRAKWRFQTGERKVHWGGGPLFHIGSLAPFIGTIGSGGTYLTDAFFDPGRALALMERERATMAWPWFPAIVQGLLDHPGFDAARLDSLRSIMLIGPPPLIKRIQKLFPNAEVMQACGMTETAGIFALSDIAEGAESRALTHGRAARGVEVRIRKIDGDGDAATDEVGEILVRGYCLMNGYYQDPLKTAEALDEEGWLHTGDLYSRSQDGSLVFNGRLKDMLKVGGENVAAIEVEAFLCEHPAVRLAEVVGRPDAALDEVPVAFVELRPGHQVTSDQIIEFCKGRIASYKIPRAVYFVNPDEWPMSATKVNKRELRSRLTAS